MTDNSRFLTGASDFVNKMPRCSLAKNTKWQILSRGDITDPQVLCCGSSIGDASYTLLEDWLLRSLLLQNVLAQ